MQGLRIERERRATNAWLAKTEKAVVGDPDDEDEAVRSMAAKAAAVAKAHPSGSTQDALTPEIRDKASRMFHDAAGPGGLLELVRVKTLLGRLGVTASEDILFAAAEARQGDGVGDVGLSDFLQILLNSLQGSGVDDDISLSTFVSLGGRRNKQGVVSAAKLRELVFELRIPINIDKLLRLYDTDNSGFIDYEEFSAMLADEDG